MSRIDAIRHAIDTMDEKAAIEEIRQIIAEPGMVTKAHQMPITITPIGEFNTPDGRKATVYTTPPAWKHFTNSDGERIPVVPNHDPITGEQMREMLKPGAIPGPPPTQPGRTDREHPATAAMLAAEKSDFQNLTDKILKDFKS